ncbi:polysaccharide pyruvyl transferase family protein [Sinomonas atrocyanea]|uniref:polysaccharide pyruvyl transferase family protein n=1 Tax=Sinomonas atrocyanea TaxID=37927 RepID=UPI00285F460A|nr:polysaccharide pyruvyl transferase family protein [Sinomonas atrocyanea]MDR6620806.1 polysaccharide pyruvyl transferase WcaK-like protein [Sinomonas atrocyanea]
MELGESDLKALVLWADRESKNLGVRVLAEGAAALAQHLWGEECVIEFQDFEAGESAVGFNRQTVLRDAARLNGPVERRLRGVDLILDTGAGDSFTDIYGWKREVLMFYVRVVARRMRIPVIMTPQTIGPFGSALSRRLAHRTIAWTVLVGSRDRSSSALGLAMDSSKILPSTDMVFFLPQPLTGPPRDVVVNVSGLLWNENPHVDSERYRQNVLRLVNELVRAGRKVSLLAHVLDSPNSDNDVPAVREVAESCNIDDVVIPSSLHDVRSSLAGARLLVGSRMHACLNAMSVGTPAIPWAYSRKFAPLFEDLGWQHGVDLRLDSNPVNATVSIIEGEKAKLDEDLDACLLAARERTHSFIEVLRDRVAVFT